MKKTISLIVSLVISITMIFTMAIPTFADTGDGSGSSQDTEISYDISKCTVSGVKKKTYTGKAVKLNIKVKNNLNQTLTEGTDYTVSYKNNVKTGTATVTMKGTGDYSGSFSKNFKIYIPEGNIVKKNGKSYIKVNNKYVKSGWAKSGGKYYYASSNKTLYTKKFATINKQRYYFDENGAVKKGVFKVGKSKYYGSVSGAPYGKLQKGRFVNYKGKRYYATGKYRLHKKGFFKVKNKYYYATKNNVIKRSNFKYFGVKVKPNKKTGAISKRVYKKAKKAGENYIVVDISDQKLKYYRKGKLFYTSNVVTGKGGTLTPTGTYSILNKQRGTYLVGAGYRSYVSYWMPFIGNSYGLHDASWRSSFGGRIYIGNGSHGCINLPKKTAATIYKYAPVGTPVIVKR